MDATLQTVEQRLARLERYVEKVEQAVKELEASVARGDMEALNEDEIRFYLSRCPDMIADAGLFLAKIRRARDYAKFDLDIIQKDLYNEAVRKKDELGLSNAKDRESYIYKNDDFRKAQRAIYEWDYNCSRAQIIYDRYQNMFIAARKLASLLPQYYQAQDLYTKYNQE